MYLRSYGNFAKAKKGMGSWFMPYDNECRHLSLDYKTPAEAYFENEKLAALDHKKKFVNRTFIFGEDDVIDDGK